MEFIHLAPGVQICFQKVSTVHYCINENYHIV